MITHVSRKSVSCPEEAAALAALLRLMVDDLEKVSESKDMRDITENMVSAITTAVRNIHKKEEPK